MQGQTMYFNVVRIVALYSALFALCNAHSRTILIPRAFTTNATLENMLSNYRVWHSAHAHNFYKIPKWNAMFTMQTTYFYQESTNRKRLEEYFFPNDIEQLSVNQDGTGTIGSPWLGLVAASGKNFAAALNLRPIRDAYGAMSKFHFDLSWLYPGGWASILSATVAVQYNLDFFGRSRGSKGVENCLANITQAFNNTAWTAGRLYPCHQESLSLDDLNCRLGWRFVQGKQGHAGIYMQAIVPMGSRPYTAALFGPLVGNGGHWAIGVGINADCLVWKYKRHEINVMTDMVYRYWFGANEQRMFDLCNSDWSRYFQYAAQGNPSVSGYAINHMIDTFHVRPRDNFDGILMLHYRHSEFHAEAGFNLWWRNSEHVTCIHEWAGFHKQLGIFDITRNGETSASKAKISQTNTGINAAPSDPVFTPIAPSDLNLDSARQASITSVTFALGFSLNARFLGYPAMTGLGASYELVNHRGGLEQWAVWLKTNMSI